LPIEFQLHHREILPEFIVKFPRDGGALRFPDGNMATRLLKQLILRIACGRFAPQ
jgi:hypothetical protein